MELGATQWGLPLPVDPGVHGDCQLGNECNASGRQQRNDAFTQATVATVAMSAGAAAVLGGGLVYFLAPTAQPVAVGVGPVAHGALVRASIDW